MTTIQQETGLDNSTVLLPRDGERSDYNIINHRRWDRLRDVLPSLAFRKSFSTFVLANLEADNVRPEHAVEMFRRSAASPARPMASRIRDLRCSPAPPTLRSSPVSTATSHRSDSPGIWPLRKASTNSRWSLRAISE